MQFGCVLRFGWRILATYAARMFARCSASLILLRFGFSGLSGGFFALMLIFLLTTTHILCKGFTTAPDRARR